MKIISWIFKLSIFFIALTFAVKNTDMVTVRYYLGVEWQAPLIFVLLVVFCAGATAGVIAMLGTIMRLRREVSRLRKQVPLSPAAPEPSVPARVAPPDVPG